MCNSCQDPSSLWTSSGCSTCGNTTDNFNQLYSTYYNKLSSLVGGKFWPGSGLPAAQFPAIDTTQYLFYLDITTGNIYIYSVSGLVWSFLYSLAGLTQGMLSTFLQAGTNITLTPVTGGLQVSAAVTPPITITSGTNINVVPVTGGYQVNSTVVIPTIITNIDTLQIVAGRGNSSTVPIILSGGLTANAATIASSTLAAAAITTATIGTAGISTANITTATVNAATITTANATTAVIGTATVTTANLTNATISSATITTENVTYLTAGNVVLNPAPTVNTDSSSYAVLVINPSTLAVGSLQRQQVLSGITGSTPPTTGTFTRGDIYIAG